MAFRYLFSKKRVHVINLISAISVLGVATGTAALIILLSAFNGLEAWVVDLYNTFDPDIKIEARTGRFFQKDASLSKRIDSVDGIEAASYSLEENALITFGDARCVATLKGVDSAFFKVSTVERAIVEGDASLFGRQKAAGIFGSGVAYSLGIGTRSMETPIEAYIPRRGSNYTLNPTEAFSSGAIRACGIFQIQPEIDLKYVLIPLDYAADLFDRRGMASAIELKLKSGSDFSSIRSKLQRSLGNSFLVKDRFEQHALLYKIINSEKWAVYLILTFILIIAIFNVTGCLTMLMVDKANDIRTLQSLGASGNMLKRVFFIEGVLIGVVGLILGICIGLITVWAQGQLGMVRIHDGQAYPVLFKLSDLALITVTVLTIAALAAWVPLRKLNPESKLEA
jgi:lipoprotein-releasing system permease protein